jgi:Ca2+/Na+ antiporter
MRKISFWAKSNPHTARSYIIIIKIMLAIIAWFVGRSFSRMNIGIPENLGILTLFIFLIAALLYPSKSSSISARKYFYLKQKSCDFALAACTFIMMVCVTNNQLYPVTTPSSHASSNIIVSKPPTAEEILTSLKYRDKQTLTKPEKKILKREFKKQLKVFANATLNGNKKDADDAALVILVIIGAIGLTLLLSALVCSISCGGADGLAVAVALLGLTAIIWGSIVLIRRIKSGPRNKERVEK